MDQAILRHRLTAAPIDSEIRLLLSAIRKVSTLLGQKDISDDVLLEQVYTCKKYLDNIRITINAIDTSQKIMETDATEYVQVVETTYSIFDKLVTNISNSKEELIAAKKNREERVELRDILLKILQQQNRTQGLQQIVDLETEIEGMKQLLICKDSLMNAKRKQMMLTLQSIGDLESSIASHTTSFPSNQALLSITPVVNSMIQSNITIAKVPTNLGDRTSAVPSNPTALSHPDVENIQDILQRNTPLTISGLYPSQYESISTNLSNRNLSMEKQPITQAFSFIDPSTITDSKLQSVYQTIIGLQIDPTEQDILWSYALGYYSTPDNINQPMNSEEITKEGAQESYRREGEQGFIDGISDEARVETKSPILSLNPVKRRNMTINHTIMKEKQNSYVSYAYTELLRAKKYDSIDLGVDLGAPGRAKANNITLSNLEGHESSVLPQDQDEQRAKEQENHDDDREERDEREEREKKDKEDDTSTKKQDKKNKKRKLEKSPTHKDDEEQDEEIDIDGTLSDEDDIMYDDEYLEEDHQFDDEDFETQFGEHSENEEHDD